MIGDKSDCFQDPAPEFLPDLEVSLYNVKLETFSLCLSYEGPIQRKEPSATFNFGSSFHSYTEIQLAN
jgi:hypothetical protein